MCAVQLVSFRVPGDDAQTQLAPSLIKRKIQRKDKTQGTLAKQQLRWVKKEARARRQSALQAEKVVSLAKSLTWLLAEASPWMDLLQHSPQCQTLNLVTVHELRMETSALIDKAVMGTGFVLFCFVRYTDDLSETSFFNPAAELTEHSCPAMLPHGIAQRS